MAFSISEWRYPRSGTRWRLYQNNQKECDIYIEVNNICILPTFQMFCFLLYESLKNDKKDFDSRKKFCWSIFSKFIYLIFLSFESRKMKLIAIYIDDKILKKCLCKRMIYWARWGCYYCCYISIIFFLKSTIWIN